MEKFFVGFADRVITPEEPVPLGGMSFDSSNRFNQRVLEDIHAIATAMTDADGTTILYITMDTVRAYNDVVAEVREKLAEQTGLPMHNILVACTHTHSAPDMINKKEPAIQRYYPALVEHLIAVALAALEDRKPATASVGNIEATGLNFVKHYQNTEPDGTVKYFGDNFGYAVYDETTRHVTDADPTLHLVRFVREGGKDVVLANWRAHPQLTGSPTKTDLSADFVGVFRNVLGAQLDCHVQYLQGACGNINPRSRLARENYTVDHNVHGARLAYFAVRCLEHDMTPVELGKIRAKTLIYKAPINHSLDHLQDKAQEILDMQAAGAKRSECMKAGEPYGIVTPNLAAFIKIRAALGEFYELELHAIAIGDELAFVTAPNELFDTNGAYVEDHSVFPKTLVCGYTCGHWFYIPSQKGYDVNSYESHCSRFFPGTGEKIADTFLELLEELKKEECIL